MTIAFTFSRSLDRHKLRNEFSCLVIDLCVVCNRIFNSNLVLCLIWNAPGVDRIFCSSGHRLCSVC